MDVAGSEWIWVDLGGSGLVRVDLGGSWLFRVDQGGSVWISVAEGGWWLSFVSFHFTVQGRLAFVESLVYCSSSPASVTTALVHSAFSVYVRARYALFR